MQALRGFVSTHKRKKDGFVSFVRNRKVAETDTIVPFLK